MKKIAIIGTGPTGIYTFMSLLKSGAAPLSYSLFERAQQAGIGMPYSDEDNSKLMLANIASIEIPTLTSTYLDWLKQQDGDFLAKFGVDKLSLHERQFLPRTLLGKFFQDQLFTLVEQARDKGLNVDVHESCEVTDIEAGCDGISLWINGEARTDLFNLAVIATGHTWPDENESTLRYFPSPWSGLLEANIPACKVGIMGTSLSAIDAVMAVVAQHGLFVRNRPHLPEEPDNIIFELNAGSSNLSITLMSRSGILPEADFYCPLPYEPLQVATSQAINRAIADGEPGLLNRVFALMVREIQLADPAWSQRVSLSTLDADSFADAYFRDRTLHNPFSWATYNLAEVEHNKRTRQTVPWRYAILRLHEAVEEAVPHLDEGDRERFDKGISKVFIDNYAAIPPESIRRLLALRTAGIIDILELGSDYDLEILQQGTRVNKQGQEHLFDIFIDARGQQALKTSDLPFPRLRQQLLDAGEEIPDVADDYTLLEPDIARGRIALGALPYLMHDQPFVQGIAVSAQIGEAIANASLR